MASTVTIIESSVDMDTVRCEEETEERYSFDDFLEELVFSEDELLDLPELFDSKEPSISPQLGGGRGKARCSWLVAPTSSKRRKVELEVTARYTRNEEHNGSSISKDVHALTDHEKEILVGQLALVLSFDERPPSSDKKKKRRSKKRPRVESSKALEAAGVDAEELEAFQRQIAVVISQLNEGVSSGILHEATSVLDKLRQYRLYIDAALQYAEYCGDDIGSDTIECLQNSQKIFKATVPTIIKIKQVNDDKNKCLGIQAQSLPWEQEFRPFRSQVLAASLIESGYCNHLFEVKHSSDAADKHSRRTKVHGKVQHGSCEEICVSPTPRTGISSPRTPETSPPLAAPCLSPSPKRVLTAKKNKKAKANMRRIKTLKDKKPALSKPREQTAEEKSHHPTNSGKQHTSNLITPAVPCTKVETPAVPYTKVETPASRKSVRHHQVPSKRVARLQNPKESILPQQKQPSSPSPQNPTDNKSTRRAKKVAPLAMQCFRCTELATHNKVGSRCAAFCEEHATSDMMVIVCK
mmetsp:Transcript_63141/g.145278  ORF Transcript_63141/g.145278 Transcript_63141/m.145278 type:complete len:524 (+) Transcript_63141:118-1689(+)